MTYALSTILHTSFEDAVERTRKALADQGFGVLTEIDMKATLKAKLGEDMDDYLILGACNPPLAHRAVNVDRQIGLLLPCNVIVRSHPTAGDDTVIVDAMDPQVMVQVSDQPGLREVANDAAEKLRAAIDFPTAENVEALVIQDGDSTRPASTAGWGAGSWKPASSRPGVGAHASYRCVFLVAMSRPAGSMSRAASWSRESCVRNSSSAGGMSTTF